MGVLHLGFTETNLAYPHTKCVKWAADTKLRYQTPSPKVTPNMGILPVLRPPVEPWSLTNCFAKQVLDLDADFWRPL